MYLLSYYFLECESESESVIYNIFNTLANNINVIWVDAEIWSPIGRELL